jgi:glycerol-3-phosphate acyltransferase PlsX
LLLDPNFRPEAAMRIALDAMGGDHAPGPIVTGAINAVRAQPDLTVVLVGNKEQVELELARASDAPLDRLPIVHASQVVGMDEKPVDALRKKRDNSISRCWQLMAGGEVKAVVSAGNTGAMVASALFNAKMFLPGVRRPGIAAVFPSHQGPIVICDVGANMSAKPEDLYQYGVMGSIYAQTILGVEAPKVGLLNVGTEEEKGTDLTRATAAIFRGSPLAGQFVGNIEGRDIYDGNARVIVCEGFVGNVLIKAGEGAVEFLFAQLRQEFSRMLQNLPAETGHTLAGSLKDLKSRYEYQEFGGGPLLGIRGACIICHGASGARAMRNALRVASTLAEDRLNQLIVEQLAAPHGGALEPESESPSGEQSAQGR